MDTLTETEESYENIIPSESDECLADYTTVKESNNIQIRRILKSMLSPRENEIISAYFGLEGPEITVEHISNKYDIAMERIRQIKERCIKRLQLNSQSREQLRCLW
jgi:RNA polymerase primary sigma factor